MANQQVSHGYELIPVSSQLVSQFGQYRVNVQDCLKQSEELQNARQARLADCRRKRQDTQQELDSLRARTTVVKAVDPSAAELPDDVVFEDVKRAWDFVTENGGLDMVVAEMRSVCTSRAAVRKLYRDSLADKRLSSKDCVYLIDWDVVDGLVGEQCERGMSIARVLPNCELPAENEDADPNKVHLQLALTAGHDTTELYVDYVEGAMTRVFDAATVKTALERVFALQNVKMLYDTDMAFHEGLTLAQYTERLKKDTLTCIHSSIPLSYTFTPSVGGPEAHGRSRAGSRSVDYRESLRASNNKRARA